MWFKDVIKAVLYKPLFNILMLFAFLVPGHSMGWAIILLTILVRIILWVPSVKSLQAPMKMRKHAPELKVIQERYKDDKQAQSQATMAFYKEQGINPFAGCLPMLIQLPIIFVLYKVFIVGLGTMRNDLLYSFTPHLETINSLLFGLDLSKPDRIFLPIITAALQFFQSRQAMQMNPPASGNDPASMMTKQMIYLFPAMTFFFALSLPAGVALYWSTTTVFSIFQQYWVMKTFKDNQSKVEVIVRKK